MKPLLSLVECKFLERLNRFVALVRINGEVKKALITIIGRLEEFMVKERKAFCIPKQGGKTESILIGFDEGGKRVIIDARTQAKAFEKAVEMGLITWLKNCRIKRKEVKIGSSSLDYLLECNGEEILVEMKSVVLREEDYAMHPDCLSLRREAYKRAYASERKRQKSNDSLHRCSARS